MLNFTRHLYEQIAPRDGRVERLGCQFKLGVCLIDVALVGMRDVATVEANVRIWHDMAGRIDLTALHARYVDPPNDGRGSRS